MVDLDKDSVATFKILLIGDSACGKSSLLLRFTDDVFDPIQHPTIGVDFKVKGLNIEGNWLKLTIWDTAGQERFRTLTSSYYRGCHGVILVYDVTRPETFEHISMWMNELETYTTNNEVVKMLVGNKVDLEDERRVDRMTGLKFAQQHSMLFIEASAVTRLGVQQAFEELVQKIYETPSLWEDAGSNGSVRLGANGQASEESCGYC